VGRPSYGSLQRLHSNFAFVEYEGRIIAGLTSIVFEIDKDVYYDIIIGSNGRPYGHPITRKETFRGSFKKALFKKSELDALLMNDSIGTHLARFGRRNDNEKKIVVDRQYDDKNKVSYNNFAFSSVDPRAHYDMAEREMVIYPMADRADNLFIGFGGVVLKNLRIELENSKFIQYTGEFIAKYITYFSEPLRS